MAEGCCEHGDEHEERAYERVQDKFDGCVDPLRTTPDADDQVHRHEDDLPEDVEEEEVEREEDTEHSCLKDQEADEVLLHARLDWTEAREDADPAEQRGQHNECGREAVYAKVISDPECGNPRDLFCQRELAPAYIDAKHHHEAERKCCKCNGECGAAQETWTR